MKYLICFWEINWRMKNKKVKNTNSKIQIYRLRNIDEDTHSTEDKHIILNCSCRSFDFVHCFLDHS